MTKNQSRRRRQLRVRSRVHGTAARPRLCVFKSLKHVYAQIIDDDAGRTLVAASTREAAVAEGLSATGGVAAAKVLGMAIGKLAVEKDIKQVVFDRAGWQYWGKVAALADAAREAGLEF